MEAKSEKISGRGGTQTILIIGLTKNKSKKI